MGLDPEVAARFVAIPNLIGVLNFGEAIVSTQELTDRLANLIEPEPERTCHVESSIYDDECECFVTKLSCGCSITDGLSFHDKYCPNCGAKVIEDE